MSPVKTAAWWAYRRIIARVITVGLLMDRNKLVAEIGIGERIQIYALSKGGLKQCIILACRLVRTERQQDVYISTPTLSKLENTPRALQVNVESRVAESRWRANEGKDFHTPSGHASLSTLWKHVTDPVQLKVHVMRMGWDGPRFDLSLWVRCNRRRVP